jgi:hypothetical protein
MLYLRWGGPRLPDALALREVPVMNVHVAVVCITADGTEQRWEVSEIERAELAMETLGLSLQEGKALLEDVEDWVVAQQVNEKLEQQRVCPHCGRQHSSKDAGSTSVKTVLGRVEVPNPRWNRCACETTDPKTFRPLDQKYIACMENVLNINEKPLSEHQPVVCVDEKPVVLHADMRPPIPMQPGQIGRRDYEYKRCGTANVFSGIEPQGERAFHQSDAHTLVA